MKGETMAVTETERKGLYTLAREAYEDSDGDMEAALELLISWVKGDQQLLDEVIHEGAYRALGHVPRKDRQLLSNPITERVHQEIRAEQNGTTPSPTPPTRQQSNISGLHIVANAAASKWFGWSVPYANTSLGDSKSSDIDRSTRELRKVVSTGTWQILFLESLKERLPETKTVRQVFSENQIEELMIAAQRSVYRRDAVS
jgi:hypothetical protein